MQQYANTVQDNRGSLVSGATITISLNGTSTPASLFSDTTGLVSIANPVTTDSNGFFSFYAADGTYNGVIVKSGLATTPFTFTLNATTAFVTNATLAASSGSSLVGFSHANTYAQGTVGLALQKFINVKNAPYNAVGDGVSDDTAAFVAAKAACDALTVVDVSGRMLESPTLFIPRGKYKTTANVELPYRTHCEGEITGNFEVIYKRKKDGFVKGVRCYVFRVNGAWRTKFDDIYASSKFIFGSDSTALGAGNGFGCYWNSIDRIEAPTIEMDHTGLAGEGLNQNKWGSLFGKIEIIGANSNDTHNNLFLAPDVSDYSGGGGGLRNTGTVVQPNLAIGPYMDNGDERIVGDWDVIGLLCGSHSMLPAGKRRTHLMFTMNPSIAARVAGDFLSLGMQNRAKGGGWDILDSTGKPTSFSTNAGATVIADANEPTGVAKTYGWAAAAVDFSEVYVDVTLVPGVTQYSAAIVFKGTNFTYLVARRNASVPDDVYYDSTGNHLVDLGNGYKLARFGIATQAGDTQLQIVIGANTGVQMQLSSVWATSEKAVPMPTARTDRIVINGSLVYDPPNLADGAGDTSAAITVTGAAFGDFVTVAAPYDLQGIVATGYVSAANTARIRLQNETGGAIDLASGTWRVRVEKQ